MIKSRKIFALTLLTTLIVFAAFNASVISAQSQAAVNVLESIGGTSDPAPGTHNYDSGTPVTFTAIPDENFVFLHWVVSISGGSNVADTNPVTIPVTGGNTYDIQPVFAPILPSPVGELPSNPGVGGLPANMATSAIVVVLAGAGGTVSPAPGTYALADTASMKLTATPASGWQFDHWVIEGPGLSHGGYPYTATPSDNPYDVNHGYGNMFSYQPVFTPIGVATPTPIPEFSSIATIVIALALVAVAFGTYAYRSKTKDNPKENTYP